MHCLVYLLNKDIIRYVLTFFNPMELHDKYKKEGWLYAFTDKYFITQSCKDYHIPHFDGMTFKQLLKYSRMEPQELVIKAAKYGDKDLVDYLYSAIDLSKLNEADVYEIDNDIACNAAKNGYLNIITNRIINNDVIENAISGGHLEIVKFLMETNPEKHQILFYEDHLIYKCIALGNIDCYNYLVSRSGVTEPFIRDLSSKNDLSLDMFNFYDEHSPFEDLEYALKCAIICNNHELAKRIIEVDDCDTCNSEMLEDPVIDGNIEIVILMLDNYAFDDIDHIATLALVYDRIDIYNMIIEKIGDYYDNPEEILLDAIYAGNKNLVIEILEKKEIDADILYDAACMAAGRGYKSILRILLNECVTDYDGILKEIPSRRNDIRLLVLSYIK